MSSTKIPIRVSEPSAPPQEPSRRPIRPVGPDDPELVHELRTALRSTVDEDTRLRLIFAQSGLRSFNQPVVVEADDQECYIASDVLGAIYGAGASESEALADFYRALDEHLRFLRSNELHPRLERQLAALERLFPDR